MNRRVTYLKVAASLGGLAVVLGAFGAHGLEEHLSEEMLAVYETGVRYHVYHTLAMLAVALAPSVLWKSRWTSRACAAWGGGIAVFSGTLYLLAVTGVRWLGAITPIGGVALIVGWALLIPAAKSLLESDPS